ncbi:hypothetical protein TNCT_715241 [Trichonephila clavata]|uniref:Uncharacterized protein n=1 Tax=Trichonephila clavata TaxID=2740835 RepID=A0A8X6H1W5_TRICU|nr:hypothetical protein TNCT_715241 [Trichonephila clavata]
MSPVGWDSLDRTPVERLPFHDSFFVSPFQLFLQHSYYTVPFYSPSRDFLPEKHPTSPFTGLFTCLKHSYNTIPFYLPSRVFLPEKNST